MREHDLFLVFIKPLNKLKIRYMVTGSVACIIYGEPRLTHDMDLVLKMSLQEAERFTSAFPLDHFYCPPLEVVKLEAGRRMRGHFNLIHHDTGFKADVYLSGQEEIHRWALDNRKQIYFEDEPLWLAPVEYVIIRKLEYFREGESEKHLNDIKGMLSVSSDQINFKELEKRINTKGLEKYWNKVLPDYEP